MHLARAFARCSVAAALIGLTVVSGEAIRERAAVSSNAVPAAPAAAPTEDWNSVRVDIQVESALVNESAGPFGNVTSRTSYGWHLFRDRGGWKNVVTVTRTRPTVQSPTGEPVEIDNPFDIVRFEDDGHEARFYNARGEEIRPPEQLPSRLTSGAPGPGLPESLPSPIDLTGAPGPPLPAQYRTIQGLILRKSARNARLEAAAQRFGPPMGHVRGLARFLRSDRDGMVEMLVDEGAFVPLEINVVRGHELVSRATFGYGPLGPDGDLVREHVTIEQRVPDQPGQRSVLRLTFSNLRFERRR